MAKAKQKRQKRKAPPQPSTSAEQGTRLDVKRLSIMLFILSILVIPIAIIMKTNMDGMTEEVLRNKYGVSSDGSDTAKAKAKEKEQTKQKQQLPQGIIDPRSFKGFWSMNKHFTQNYDSKGLYNQLKYMFEFNERAYDPSRRKSALNSAYKSRGAGFDRTTRHKLEHDLEQFDYYLRNEEMRKNAHGLELFRSAIPNLYTATLTRLDQASKRKDFDEENEFYSFQMEDREIMNYYNRAIFLPTLSLVQGSLLTPRDWAKVEREWMGEEISYPHPGIVVIDNLLSPHTLKRVRDYLLLSTFWYEAKLPRYGHYLGAYLNDGMHDPIMMDIANDLHKEMPRVMMDHHLKEMWSYKYESSSSQEEGRTGIHVHADDAMVNVNLWITPDEANLDPHSGGLIVYTVKPPPEWTFSNFNSNWDYIDEHLLRPSGYANVTIPYKQNRAVIFDSFLFHKSDKHRFKQGYENRRINLTFLYGDKQSVESSDGASED